LIFCHFLCRAQRCFLSYSYCLCFLSLILKSNKFGKVKTF
jgi:hypothetical protein